jgi:acyl carrier protein
VSSPQEPVRDIVTRLTEKQLHLGDRKLSPEDDLWNLGMTSLTCMGLMLEIEDAFGVELPADRLNHETFTSVNGIVAAVQSAQEGVRADGTCVRT